ncbi:SH3 domain-containing protein [Clostridium sp.]|uniref:SH3 domain-containing protein n=1 Tax=Clostridium sp. TaxID=1506 RepID=UPI003F3C7AA0
MKKPKKIIVISTAVILIATIGCGLVLKNKKDKEIKAMSNIELRTGNVERGDIEVTVAASGTITSNSSDSSKLEVQVDVDELDISKIQLNQKVEVSLEAIEDKTFEAVVTDIESYVQQDSGLTTYTVVATLLDEVIETGVINEDANIRSGNSSKYLAVNTVKENDKVQILEENDDWYKVKLSDGTFGWVSTSYVDIEGINENVIATVNKSSANIRSGASTGYSIKAKVINGDKLEILDKDGNWYKVKLTDESEGWINKEDIYTSEVKPGMTASLEIVCDRKDDVLYVPIEGVKKDNDGNYFVNIPSTSETKAIEVGIHNEDYIEISSGLNEDEEIQLPSIKENSSSNEMGMPGGMPSMGGQGMMKGQGQGGPMPSGGSNMKRSN